MTHGSLSSTIRMKPAIVPGALDDEAVSDTMHGDEMTRRGRVRLQLLTQPDHVCVDGARVREGFVAPDGIQDYVPFQDAIRVLQKKGQQIVFSRGELQGFSM